MEVKYIFTSSEKLLIKELSEINNTYNYSTSYDAFRDKYKEEINSFIDNGLLYHSNSGSEGSWSIFSVPEKGLKIFTQIK